MRARASFGIAAMAGALCTAGSCALPTSGLLSAGDDDAGDAADAGVTCAGGLSPCGPACVDLANDPHDCGACGHACGAVHGSALCVSGACAFVCSTGWTHCGRTGLDDAQGCATRVDDPDNCGACGRSCLGGDCASGKCRPLVFAAGQDQPTGIAVDETGVFWSNRGAADSSGSLVRANTDGTGRAMLASSRPYPARLALDATDVWWTEEGSSANNWADGTIQHAAKDGSCAQPPCPHKLIGWQPHPYGIVLDGDFVYATRYGGYDVWRYPKNGSAPAVVSVGEQLPLMIAISSGSLFWTNLGTQSAGYTDGAVRTAPTTGTGTTVAGSQYEPWGIAADGSFEYWVDFYGGDLLKATHSLPQPPVKLAKALAYPQYVALDDEWAYFTLAGPNAAGPGSIEAIRKDGTCPDTPCPRVLADGGAVPGGIAVDAAAVYWTEPARGNVMKLAK